MNTTKADPPLLPVLYQPGDHLRVPIGNLAWHHGVYLGEGRVAHWHDGRAKDLDDAFWERKREASIRVTDLETFQAGRHVERIGDPAAFPPAEIVRRALSRVGEDGYHLTDNNCEHYARWCRHGTHASDQVVTAEKWIARHGDAAFRAAALAVLRRSAPGLLRMGARGGPLLAVLSEVAERAGGRALRTLRPDDPDFARRGGKAASGLTCAATGLAMGGPAGAAAGLAVWAAGEAGARVARRGVRWAASRIAGA